MGAVFAKCPAIVISVKPYRPIDILNHAQDYPQRSSLRVDKCAEHVQQLGSESLLPNLMGVKG